jgi:ribose transport system ATP-binding protein
MRNISKSFPGVAALKNARFKAYKGRVTALLGENGAGKSTLMKTLCGVHKPDGGEIILRGKNVMFKNTYESAAAGIAMIHQELNLIPRLSIADNLFLGREIRAKTGGVDRKKTLAMAEELLARVNLRADPSTAVNELSVGMRQMVEIAKALTVNAELIIMDEPTASLADKDVARLFELIKTLKERQTAIVYISHRMNEIFSICDDVTIMRDGEWIMDKEISLTSEGELVEAIVGRKMEEQYPFFAGEKKRRALEIKNITGKNIKGSSAVFYAGETTGFFGLVGSGRTELARAIFGAYPARGSFFADGKALRLNNPQAALAAGIVYLSEDRKGDGLVLSLSVAHNTTLCMLRELRKLFFCLDAAKEKTTVTGLVKKLKIKTAASQEPVKNLSGGNQQKVAFARALTVNPRFLILDEPTRGIDVGAKKEIYTLINELKSSGIAVVMISSDLNEILGVCDRTFIFYEGAITGCLERGDMTSERIMRYAINLENDYQSLPGGEQ